MTWKPRTHPFTLDPFDLYLFAKGRHWTMYKVLGAHPWESGYRFAVWAPNAKAVSLVGGFNDWTPGEHPLYPVGDSGIWGAFVPDLAKGSDYKFAIHQSGGALVFKNDPFAFRSEMRPANSSITWSGAGTGNYVWGDGDWIARRSVSESHANSPVSIYEVHAGSWRRRGYDPDSFLSCRDLAEELVPHVRDLGFTHIEFLPIMEHPLDESWGYQIGQYFAPSARYGLPEDFKFLVDRCHQAGLGVILDWVPASFPKDDWGLYRFDGTPQYEHPDLRRSELPAWGTCAFDYAKPEVRNFLLANALYWLKEYHVDGLRVGVVDSMLYLDYHRAEGDWLPNEYGGKENIEAIRFLRKLGSIVHDEVPGALLIAEDASGWPGLTMPTYANGFGFDFRIDFAWLRSTAGYLARSAEHRPYHHCDLVSSASPLCLDRFILPLSHDEVSPGKGSLLSQMPGDNSQRLANLRLLYAYQWARPGKKLLFMGCEFGHWRAWDVRGGLDWNIPNLPSHAGILRLVADLNSLYRTEQAMHELDGDRAGFEWGDYGNFGSSVISFMRKDSQGRSILWVFNFSAGVQCDYAIGCRTPGYWREVFNSDSFLYGGTNIGNGGGVTATEGGPGPWALTLSLTVPPLGAIALKSEGVW